MISIVVPAFNEAGRLPATMRKITDFCSGYEKECEVVIVVEKSTDETLELAKNAAAKQENFRVMDNVVQRGKGHAVRTGMLAARGEFLFYTDADLSVPIEEVPRFVRYFEQHPGIDVLAGNRKHPESRIIRPQGFVRQKMGEGFNTFIRLLTDVQLRDTQCGFKGFRNPAARDIFTRQKLDGFAFDLEVLILAGSLGYRIADLPVPWTNSPESKVRLLRDSARMLRDVLRLRALLR